MSKHTTKITSARRALIVGLIALAALGLVAAPANASHAGFMELRGKVTRNGSPEPGATVVQRVWTGSYWADRRTVTTNSYGSYVLTAGRQHSYYLVAGKAFGACVSGQAIYNGWTNSFYTSASSPSPSYINVPIYFSHWFYC